MRYDEWGYSAYWGDKKCIQNFGEETSLKAATSKSRRKLGRVTVRLIILRCEVSETDSGSCLKYTALELILTTLSHKNFLYNSYRFETCRMHGGD
jgi:hypothetical protein